MSLPGTRSLYSSLRVDMVVALSLEQEQDGGHLPIPILRSLQFFYDYPVLQAPVLPCSPLAVTNRKSVVAMLSGSSKRSWVRSSALTAG